MVYHIVTRAKKKRQDNNIANKPTTKENPIADKLPVQQQHPVNSIASELGNINHNLDVFTQNIKEDTGSFNKDTILMLDIGNRLTSDISNNEYRVVCKIGYGGSSIIWLIIDMKSNEFKVAKVSKYRHGFSKIEEKILHETTSHPNILRFYEQLVFNSCCMSIYEPLGKDLYMLMKEASKYGGGLPIPVIKKIAKHVLNALKTIHGLKVIHTDIKLQNIATCVSQLSLRCQLEKIVKTRENFSSLRMVCQQKNKLDENKVRKVLEEELDKITKLDIKEMTQLIFKLIDFGNALDEGAETPTGTYGFRPPEYFFGSPLLPSHDIWALGVTIVVLLTNKMFLEFGLGKEILYADSEIVVLRNMFGKFSRRRFKHFKAYKDPHGFQKKSFLLLPYNYQKNFTAKKYNSKKAEKQIKKVLQAKFNKLQMLENDKEDLVDFLFHMLNTIPAKRKSAEELLSHPWLKEKGTKPNKKRIGKKRKNNRHKSQSQKEASVNISGTPVAVSSSSSSSCDTSGISLGELSIDEKHLKNIDETTKKSKSAPKNNQRVIFNSFIDKENGEFILYHKNWKIKWRGKPHFFFRCPKEFCRRGIYFGSHGSLPKIGFVMVSDKKWHNHKCPVSQKWAPKRFEDEVERKRQSLLKRGFKPQHNLSQSDAINQKEAENLEGLIEEEDSNESEDETDSSTYESEEDSNKTISEFGSGESYFEEDASIDPHVNYSKNEELNNVEWFEI